MSFMDIPTPMSASARRLEPRPALSSRPMLAPTTNLRCLRAVDAHGECQGSEREGEGEGEAQRESVFMSSARGQGVTLRLPLPNLYYLPLVLALLVLHCHFMRAHSRASQRHFSVERQVRKYVQQRAPKSESVEQRNHKPRTRRLHGERARSSLAGARGCELLH
jgi:hypothetical protein